IAEDDCQIHHRIWRSQGGPEMADNMELLHANCHRQIHVQERRTEATASRKGRQGMLELDEGQLSRPVLRGRGGSNTSLLPGRSVDGSSQRGRVCARPDPAGLAWSVKAWNVEREA